MVFPHLAPEAGYRRVNLLYKAILILLFLFVGGMGIWHITLKKTYRPAVMALVTVLFFGGIYMLIFPPFSTPDEDIHYANAYTLSNMLMFQETTDADGYVYMRADDAALSLPTEPEKEEYLYIAKALFSGIENSEMIVSTYQGTDTFIWIYLPQALGLTLGRLLQAGPLLSWYLARFFNLLVYGIMIYKAVSWMPFASFSPVAISLMPMVLELISSLSYDAGVIGLSLMFTAYALRLIYISPTVKKKDVVMVTLLMAFLTPVKVIYSVLALLMFCIPKQKFGTRKKYGMTAGVMILGMIATTLAAQASRFVIYLSGNNTTPEAIGGEGYQLSTLLLNPGMVAKIYLESIRRMGGTQLGMMLGDKLGYIIIPVNLIIIMAVLLCLIFSVIHVEQEPLYVTWKHKWIFTAICVAIYFLANFLMLLAWTQAGLPYIQGVQGRYYIPGLLLLLCITRSRNLTLKYSVDHYLYFIMSLANAWAVANVVEYIVEPALG